MKIVFNFRNQQYSVVTHTHTHTHTHTCVCVYSSYHFSHSLTMTAEQMYG